METKYSVISENKENRKKKLSNGICTEMERKKKINYKIN